MRFLTSVPGVRRLIALVTAEVVVGLGLLEKADGCNCYYASRTSLLAKKNMRLRTKDVRTYFVFVLARKFSCLVSIKYNA